MGQFGSQLQNILRRARAAQESPLGVSFGQSGHACANPTQPLSWSNQCSEFLARSGSFQSFGLVVFPFSASFLHVHSRVLKRLHQHCSRF